MPGEFEPRIVEVGDDVFRFQVWRPPAPRPGLPILLFLHGAGERGDDGMSQTRVGLGPALLSAPERWPVLAVLPQCRSGFGWRGPMMRQAVAALDAVLAEFDADPSRQLLTGISMGGFGSWRLALDMPDRFAAVAPICGGLDASPAAIMRAGPGIAAEPHRAAAALLGDLPVWVFHGSDDAVIPVEESRRMVEALRTLGGRVRYTEYPEVGHNSWDLAYGDPELPRWLLKHHR